MSAPVINTTTSILGYAQWEQWEYQPYATNAPTSWACPNLPAGLSIDTPTQYAITGAEATDIITATGNDFVDGMAVVMPSLTGGAGLSANVIYYIRDRSTHTFKLAASAGGVAINFTTDISAGSISRLPTGKISGAASVAGVFVCGLTASNADGTSAALALTIGIEAANAALTSSGYEVKVDVATRTIEFLSASAPSQQAVEETITSGSSTKKVTSTVSVDGKAPKLYAKYQDSLLLWLTFQKNGQALDLAIESLCIAIKEVEPDSRLVLGETFKKFGTGSGAYYGLYADLAVPGLLAALSNYEEDKGTAFEALAEIEWQEANPEYAGGFGPEFLRFTTKDFLITLARDMSQAA
jgi:hypothetical protein